MLSFPAYPSTIYAIIFTVSFWSWILFEAWVFARERGAMRDSSRDRGSTFLVILIVFIGVTLAINLPHIVPQLNMRSSFPLFFALGVVLTYAGILFRYWSVHTLGRYFRTRVMIQEQHQLITSGPYKYLRNPSYTALLAILGGLGLETGNWLSVLALFAAVVIAYAWRIAHVEEPALARQFGAEFQDYKKRSWALIPFIW